ncbi:MAG: nucleotide pyrophosphohydrolase [Bacteroidia bacterium]
MQSNPTLAELVDALAAFRDARDWGQFHNAKDLALSIEAAELNELFLWKSPDAADPARLKEELADVFAYALLLADRLGFDVRQIVLDKLELNAAKYPIDKARGSARKYDALD